MATTSRPLKAKSIWSQAATEVNLNYIPELGLNPFEVLNNTSYHQGTSINNLIDVSGKSKKEVFDAIGSLDSRAIPNMPDEVLEQIKSGNIEHIFTTDPTKSGALLHMSEEEARNIVGNANGSIYLRTKEGQTARWKLPEISGADAGWNANKGASYFSDQTVFNAAGDNSLTYALAIQKNANGVVPSGIDPKIVNNTILDDIIAKKSSTFGAGAPVFPAPNADAARTASQKSSKSRGSTLGVGNATNSSTEVASRTNISPVNEAVPSGPIVSNAPVTSSAERAEATIKATISSSTTHVAEDVVEGVASTGAPVKATTHLRSIADNASAKVAKGGNLKLLGLGAVIGIGAMTYSRRNNRSNNADQSVRMQRGQY